MTLAEGLDVVVGGGGAVGAGGAAARAAAALGRGAAAPDAVLAARQEGGEAARHPAAPHPAGLAQPTEGSSLPGSRVPLPVRVRAARAPAAKRRAVYVLG